MGNKKNHSLRTFFVIIGAIVSIGAILVVLYAILKKYFKITFACEDDCDCCDCCDCDECFEEEANYEPICCCHEDCVEEAVEEAVADETADEDAE